MLHNDLKGWFSVLFTVSKCAISPTICILPRTRISVYRNLLSRAPDGRVREGAAALVVLTQYRPHGVQHTCSRSFVLVSWIGRSLVEALSERRLIVGNHSICLPSMRIGKRGDTDSELWRGYISTRHTLIKSSPSHLDRRYLSVFRQVNKKNDTDWTTFCWNRPLLTATTEVFYSSYNLSTA